MRIRPGNGLTTGDRLVRGVSKDSVSVGDKKFTFDSVFDSNSTQVRRLFQKFQSLSDSLPSL